MTVLDAQAVIAFLTDEPARPIVEALLRDDADPIAIVSVSLAECVDVLVRVKSVPEGEAASALELVLESVSVIDVDAGIARAAGLLRARHHHRASRPVSLPDCLALAAAMSRHERLATSDAHLVAMAGDEGCETLALPDQLGRLRQS